MHKGQGQMLSERVKTPPGKTSGFDCSVGALLRELPDDEKAALEQMLGSPEQRSPWSAQQIYDALLAEGHQVGRQTIGHHRGRRCRCFK
jgi:hypothetical protein